MKHVVKTRLGKPTLLRQVFEWVKANPGWTPSEIGSLLATEKHTKASVQATVSDLVRGGLLAKDPETRKVHAIRARFTSPHQAIREKRAHKPAPGSITEVKPTVKPSFWQRVGNWLWR